MSYAIDIKDLHKEFMPTRRLKEMLSHPFRKGKNILAINGVNLKVKRGEVVALVGPNGAGKTTLIKILCSLILPTRGVAYVNGYDIARYSEKVKNSIGLVVSEERSFYWRLTGRQNLEFFSSLCNLSGRQAKLKIQELMQFLEIEEPDRYFQEYSTGIKQRIAIARSLLNDPQILFLDEPTKSLDPIASQRLRFFIKDRLVRQKGKTIFFTSHNLDEIDKFSDKLAIMDRGKIVIQGNARELKQSIGNPQATMEEVFSHYVSLGREK